jgi:hypothetical protein
VFTRRVSGSFKPAFLCLGRGYEMIEPRWRRKATVMPQAWSCSCYYRRTYLARMSSFKRVFAG